jgi:hypothetical protein
VAAYAHLAGLLEKAVEDSALDLGALLPSRLLGQFGKQKTSVAGKAAATHIFLAEQNLSDYTFERCLPV